MKSINAAQQLPPVSQVKPTIIIPQIELKNVASLDDYKLRFVKLLTDVKMRSALTKCRPH